MIVCVLNATGLPFNVIDVSVPTATEVGSIKAAATQLASRLNVTPEHFSRILHDLVDAGLIKVDGRDVTIFEAVKLREAIGQCSWARLQDQR